MRKSLTFNPEMLQMRKYLPSKIIAPLLIWLFTLTTPVAQADEIIMQNGDRLSGTVVSKQGDTLLFSTPYAGELKILWHKVISLRTDKAVRIQLDDNNSLQAQVAPAGPGMVQLQGKELGSRDAIGISKIAQINPPRGAADSGVKVKGYINAGFELKQGNSDTEKLHLDTEVVARTRENRYTIGAEYNREKDQNTETVSNRLGYMKYDHFLSEKWYLYANGTFKKDKFKDLNLRSTIGLGSGRQLWESDERSLSLEAGLTYVNDDFIVATDNDYAALRWAIKYDQRLWKKLQLFHEHEGLQGLESSDDISIRSKTGIRVPIIDNLKATAQVNADWENNPAPGKKREDLTYLLSLGYHW